MPSGICNQTGRNHNFNDIINKRFGQLVAIKYTYSDEKGQAFWECRCDCGNTKAIQSSNLTSKNTQSCGCYHRRSRKEHIHYQGCGDLSLTAFSEIKIRAKNRNWPFDLTIEYLWKLFIQQNKKCALTGIDLTFSSQARKRDGNASLDRVDSSKGYIPRNVQWVDKEINIMKWNLSQEKFIKLCNLVSKYNENL